MKANELRCTNLVFYNGKHCKIALVGISGEIELYTEIIDWVECCGIEDIQPIPLTPEMLEKAGWRLLFEKTYENNKFDIWLSESKNGGYTFTSRPDGGKLLYFLHQLQNLYFALTGEELRINK